MATEKDIMTDVLEAENSAIGTFQPLWDSARRNSEIYGLKHWTSAEEARITKQHRIPYKMDKTSHAINVLVGTQRSTRFDIFFYERTQEDGPRVETLNAVWKYFADKYDFPQVETDVFLDGIVAKYGVFECGIDYMRDPRGDLRIWRVPWDEVLWDDNFRQYDLTDAYWMSRMRFYRREELLALNPEKKELIELSGLDSRFPVSREMLDHYFRKEKNLVGVHEFFERGTKNKYVIWQKGKEDFEDQIFETKKEAEAEAMNRRQYFEQVIMQAAAMAVMNGQMPMVPPIPEYDVEPIPLSIVTKTEVVANGVLAEPEEYRLGDFPLSLYFSNFHDGKFWSALDRLKDPQEFINRMYSQLDHWIGTMAKGLLVGDSRIPEKEWKKLKEAWGKTGGAVRTKYAKDVQALTSQGPAPQLFGMLDRVDNMMDESMGGANFLGIKETASESGRAVLARQSQAGLDAFNMLDNMKRTKQNLGVKIVDYLTNDISDARKLRITGEPDAIAQMSQGGAVQQDKRRPNVGYMEINTKSSNTIKDLEVDIVVDEAAHSPTKNMQILGQLTDAFKAGVITTPIPPQVAMKLLNLPASLQQEWQNAIAQMMQAEANKPPEPPKMSVSVNYKDLPTEAQGKVLERAGFPASDQSLTGKQIIDKPHLTAKEKNDASQ